MSGLEGIEVGSTRLSQVDGQAGRLRIGGYPVEVLAGAAGFEEVLALLWHGEWPGEEAAQQVRRDLGAARVRVAATVAGPAPELPEPMAELRARVARLAPSGSPWEEVLEVVAGVGVALGALAARRAGRPAPTPDPDRGHAADLLRMLLGREPGDAEASALEGYLVTVSDHGMNASTFTARVVASTGSDLASCVVAAIGALKGPLHGGAPGPVLDMLEACAAAESPDAWLRAELAAGRRLMGMGHRVYRVRDPRAAALEEVLRGLQEAGAAGADRLPLARTVEARAEALLAERHPERALRANVEFYTAVLLDALGLPRELFAPIFAAARVAGWCAHVREQRDEGRLIRPRVAYHGPAFEALRPPGTPSP